jgi:assimilatory nitrate reductase catalytic subunit
MNLVANGHGVSVKQINFPTNNGGHSHTGWTSGVPLEKRERLLSPLIRRQKDGPLATAEWDEALEFIAANVRKLQARYGPDSLGVFGGAGLTNEKAYLLGKFARVTLRTSRVDSDGRFCMSAAAASMKAFGMDRGLPFPLEDIQHAQSILLIGSNMAETRPPILQHFEAQAKNGGSLIVVDPRATPTARAATLHLQITPGTDAALANGLLYIAIKEGYIDEAFINERTSGFGRVRVTAASYWPDRVERITGIPERQLALAARMLGEASSAMILTACEPEQQVNGVTDVLAFINLALALGKSGKPHCGYGCLTAQGNQKADQLAGYRKIDSPEHRAHIARIWGIREEDLPKAGRPAHEMLDDLGKEGGVRGLFVFGSNLAMSAPRAGHVQKRLQALDFLMVSDTTLSETAELGDVVLPSAQCAEEEGTLTDIEGRVLLRKKQIEPQDGVRTDLQAIAAIASRLGCGGKFCSDPAMVFDELRRASAGGVADYAGITYERIEKEEGVFWPCPSEDHPGTRRVFLDKFATADGRARFHPVEFSDAVEQPDQDYPLYLTTYLTAGRLMRSSMRPVSKAYVQIHPSMAQTYGIAEGDPVDLTTRRGRARMSAQLTSTIRMDTVFVPFHFAGESRANLLTNPVLDPNSRVPEVKVCAVRIEKGTLC